MQQQEKNNNKGFNILELLVVLAIVGIISAVAYPGFSSWTKERKLNQAVERIQSLMKNILIQTPCFLNVWIKCYPKGLQAWLMTLYIISIG